MTKHDYEIVEIPLVKRHNNILLMLLGEQITEINNSASIFIDAIYNVSNKKNIDMVCDDIAKKYNIDSTKVIQDLIQFIKTISKLGGIKLLDNADHINELPDDNITTTKSYDWLKKLTTPVYIAWNLTSKCNMACTFCYSRNRGDDLSLDENKTLLDKLIRSSILEIGFGGGECFLYKGFFDLAKIASDANVRVSVTTNGSIYNNSIHKKIKDVGFHSIAISFDSSNADKHDAIRGKGAFQRATETAQKLRQLQIPLDIVTVITKKNMNDVIGIANLARHLGARKVIFKEFKPSGLGLTNQELFQLSIEEKKITWETILNHQKTNSSPILDIGLRSEPLVNSLYGDGSVRNCSCGTMSACLRENGKIMVCSYSDNHIGNLLEDDLETIWRRVNICSARSNHEDRPICGAVAYLTKGRFTNLSINN